MANSADELTNKFIAHAVDLSRFEEDLRQKVLYNLRLLEDELTKDILEGLGTGYSQAKLAALKAQTKQSIASAYSTANDQMSTAMIALAKVESSFVGNAVNSSIGANLVTTTLLPDQLESIAKKNMLFGSPAREFWKKQAANMADRFMTEMRLGVSRGETLGQLVQRVGGKSTGKRFAYKTKAGKQRYLVDFKGGIMDMQTRNAEALVRTATQQVANEVRHKTLVGNPDVIKGQAWLSTLDMRTTPYCAAMDGLEWDLEGKPLGGHSEPFNPPPSHWNCRSCLVPLLKSWAEMSESKSSELKKKLSKAEKKIPPSTRAAMGAPVSEKLNYKQWFDRQPEAIQLDILGPGKLAIYRRGNLSFRAMIDQRGNPLTIAELEKRVGG
jgi:SPP1 gp7 family putative phage head morphogenesis protein